MLGNEALDKILTFKEIKTLLDAGSGYGNHANKFAEANLDVTAIDIVSKPAILSNKVKYLQGFMKDFLPFEEKFDCVWSSHCLEHVLDTQLFINQLNESCKEGGYLAITVPPLKNDIVGGHVSLFNAGIILYRLVLAKLDVSEAMVKKYGYNISIIVKKKTIQEDFWKKLKFDRGDIETISEYLPKGYNYHGFDGDIDLLNW